MTKGQLNLTSNTKSNVHHGSGLKHAGINMLGYIPLGLGNSHPLSLLVIISFFNAILGRHPAQIKLTNAELSLAISAGYIKIGKVCIGYKSCAKPIILAR